MTDRRLTSILEQLYDSYEGNKNNPPIEITTRELICFFKFRDDFKTIIEEISKNPKLRKLIPEYLDLINKQINLEVGIIRPLRSGL